MTARAGGASDGSVAEASPRARIGLGAAIVVAILALTVTVGIGILRGAAAPVETVTTSHSSDSTADDAEGGGGDATRAGLYVHVSGAVNGPGLYLLHEGDRVVDAVAAAGGFAPGADEQAVNLARILSDGEQLVVPLVGQEPVGGAAAAPAAGDGRVNLNTADAGALDTLPRIGPALAQRIIDWREANGRFTSVEDLLAVPGIGDKMLESLRDLVSI
ncbi:MAG: ComEA family DNA-binding protein [Microbacterium pygmaeum]